jgi:three-Cys-motif partner protein
MQEFVKDDDGLPIYACGSWTIHKLFHLCQYLATTTTAMVGNNKFKSVNYIDLFSSSGVCQTQSDGSRHRRYPGSALLAAGCTKPFDNLFLVEEEKGSLDALKSRIARLGSRSSIHTWNDDANKIVTKVAQSIPEQSLNVAFIDPYALDIHFSTIKTLALARPLDLLILFADAMDVVRNIDEYYLPGKSDKLDLFLGTREWRDGWKNLANQRGTECCRFFSDIYRDELRKIGYTHSATLPIRSDSGPLYRLVYASKHSLGLKFWNAAAREDFEGNRSLWE